MRSVRAGVFMLLATGSVALAGLWGSEVLVDSGAVTAFDATADTSGVIWAAIAHTDNAVGLYHSEDFGSTWHERWTMHADSAIRQLRVLSGSGDSSFVYLFMLEAGNGGDLWLARIPHDSTGSNLMPVAVGPDTIDDFSVAIDRDDHYYLYCLYVNEHRAGRTGAFTRSLDYGASWELGTDWWNAWDPCVSYTSGTTIHCAWRDALNGGEIDYSFNRHYGMPGHWSTYRVVSDSTADQCFDPTVVQADSSPESQAAVWVFYTAGQRDSAIRDLHFSASWDDGQDWAVARSFGDPFRDEQQPVLAADVSGPNGYVSLCYTSGNRQDGDTVAASWTCANSLDLDDWLKPVKVSQFPLAGLPPKVVYAPHAPMRLPGVFYSEQRGSGSWGVRFTAPWLASPSPAPDSESPAPSSWPTPSTGPVRLSASLTRPGCYSLAVYDAAGRLVASLFHGWLEPGTQVWTWGGKSLSGRQVPAGTFFMRLTGPGVYSSHRFILL